MGICKLSQLIDVKPGFPFRGKIEASPNGGVKAVQLKDIATYGSVDWESVIAVELGGRKTPEWLKADDMLFSARGTRNFATWLGHVPGEAVCSPHFFHLTNPSSKILPAFLAWQINQEPAQQYLRSSAEGSRLPNIRRKVLEDMPISVPSIEKQRQIIALDKAWQQEQQVLQALTDNMKRTMTGLAQQLLRDH